MKGCIKIVELKYNSLVAKTKSPIIINMIKYLLDKDKGLIACWCNR